MTTQRKQCVYLAVALLAGVGGAVAGGYEAAPATDGAFARCRAISLDRYWTGLLMNPPGMQTGHERSRCFQAAATRHRDSRLCRHALERRSWLFDGSGTSPAACATAVQAQIAKDKAAARLLRDPQRPTGLTAYRNGNGRDIDFLFRTSGGSGSRLWVTLSIVGAQGREHIVLSRPQPMDSAPGDLNLFVPASDIVRTLGAPVPNRETVVRVTLEQRLDDPDSRAIHAHAPHIRRSGTAEGRFNLATLQRAPLTRVR